MIAEKLAQQIVSCFKNGNKVLIFGNGGSLADASHFAAEFHELGPVIALDNAAKITSIANDHSFETIFSYQIHDLGVEGDIAIGLSSSGKSANVIRGLIQAKLNRLTPIDWPRKGRGTQEVQNYQYKLLHDVYLLVKEAFI